MSKHLYKIENFFERAEELRAIFDTRFARPLTCHSGRFVWDYWYVRRWFTFFRTPSSDYFGLELFNAFEARLLAWAERKLGVSQHTLIWLSYYINGCHQGLHRDTANGPWSFVYSLTPTDRKHFRGGETLIARPNLIDYWRTNAFDNSAQIFEVIPPEFNQLIVFDSRLPHCVAQVEGTMEPREGRLVMHGWLLADDYVIKGKVDKELVTAVLNKESLRLKRKLSKLKGINGSIVFRLTVAKTGAVDTVSLVSDTLLRTSDKGAAPALVGQTAIQHLRGARFPKSGSGASIIIPLSLA